MLTLQVAKPRKTIYRGVSARVASTSQPGSSAAAPASQPSSSSSGAQELGADEDEAVKESAVIDEASIPISIARLPSRAVCPDRWIAVPSEIRALILDYATAGGWREANKVLMIAACVSRRWRGEAERRLYATVRIYDLDAMDYFLECLKTHSRRKAVRTAVRTLVCGPQTGRSLGRKLGSGGDSSWAQLLLTCPEIHTLRIASLAVLALATGGRIAIPDRVRQLRVDEAAKVEELARIAPGHGLVSLTLAGGIMGGVTYDERVANSMEQAVVQLGLRSILASLESLTIGIPHPRVPRPTRLFQRDHRVHGWSAPVDDGEHDDKPYGAPRTLHHLAQGAYPSSPLFNLPLAPPFRTAIFRNRSNSSIPWPVSNIKLTCSINSSSRTTSPGSKTTTSLAWVTAIRPVAGRSRANRSPHRRSSSRRSSSPRPRTSSVCAWTASRAAQRSR